MSKILDQESNDQEKHVQKKDKLAFFYSTIMLIGGILIFKYFLKSGAEARIDQLAFAALITQTICILISVIFNLTVQAFTKKSKDYSKLFWLKNVERGFVIWIIMMSIMVFDKIFA